MERYVQIGKANLKFNLYPHLLLSVLLLLLSPFLMGTQNLNATRTAGVLEQYVALLGILLLTPIFLPEQNKDIRDLVEVKYTSSTAVTLIRLTEAVISLAVLVGCYLLYLKYQNCTFPIMNYYLGTMAGAIFLGGMGLCAYSIFDQIAIAYMLPIMYYIMALGGGRKLLKNFYPFSMRMGSYSEKVFLAITGIILIAVGISYPYIAKRYFPKLSWRFGRQKV